MTGFIRKNIAINLIAFIPLLIYLGFFALVIYVIITSLNLMRQRNAYLKEIRDELKKNNGFNN